MYQNQNLSGRFCFLLLFKKFMLVRLAIFLSNLQKELKDISVRGGIRRGWGRLRKVTFSWFGFAHVVGCMQLYCLIWKFERGLKCVSELIAIHYVFFEAEACHFKILLTKITKDCKKITIKQLSKYFFKYTLNIKVLFDISFITSQKSKS